MKPQNTKTLRARTRASRAPQLKTSQPRGHCPMRALRDGIGLLSILGLGLPSGLPTGKTKAPAR